MDSATVTRQRGLPFTPHQRQAIAAALGSGRSHLSIAQEFNCNRVTVSRIAAELRQATLQLGGDWKTAQVSRAIRAVDKGLDHDADPYKRADLGVKVLTGLQVYKPAESSTTTNNTVIVHASDLPPDWHDRLIGALDVEFSRPALDADNDNPTR